MGTRYAVSVIGGDEASANELQAAIDERLAEVNRQMSTYDPKSELSLFNASDSTHWVEVSEETASVVEAALELAGDYDGSYDPTVGPLVNLWGFGPAERADGLPSDAAVEAARAVVGYELVDVQRDPPALKKSEAGVYVDLSSIAKGHGVDAIAALLDERSIKSYMVEIGGEVRAKGRKPGGLPWRVGVERADEPLRISAGKPRLQEVVELVDQSMATSGDYRNYFEVDGTRYS
ncbi:MAG: FAD:protein FMN transferase, partial [Planctomycetota bacterium]